MTSDRNMNRSHLRNRECGWRGYTASAIRRGGSWWRFGDGFQREGIEAFQIGLFHCNAGGNPQYDNYAPRSESELVAAGFDYWALGHIHETTVIRKANPFIGYPGNTQGRHINEAVARAFSRADFRRRENGSGTGIHRHGLCPLARRQYRYCGNGEFRRTTVACGGNNGRARRSCRRTTGHRKDRRLRAGDGPPAPGSPCGADLLDELHARGAARFPFVWVEQIVDQTRPHVDLDARRGAQDFLGDLLRLIDELRGSAEKTAEFDAALCEFFNTRRGKIRRQAG